MKYFSGPTARLELTRRNLTALLAKLDDPASSRTLIKDSENNSSLLPHRIAVTAVEDEEHYADRAPGAVYVPSTGEGY